jgi:hypothetical protein
MLKIYLTSIVIWMIINFCTIQIFQFKIKDNGWLELETTNQTTSPFMYLFTMSAVPLIRVLVLVVIIYMSIYTKEQFEEYKIKHEKDDE